MIEVLVTIIILTFGLLGLAGMQSRLQQAEMESYQRSQALIILDDLSNRLANNPAQAPLYALGTNYYLGTGKPYCTNYSFMPQVYKDLCDWNNAMLGAGETLGGSRVGAMIGARGCVERITATSYLVSVAWQGLGPIAKAQQGGSACAAGLYNSGSVGACQSGQDTCRRIVSTIVATN